MSKMRNLTTGPLFVPTTTQSGIPINRVWVTFTNQTDQTLDCTPSGSMFSVTPFPAGSEGSIPTTPIVQLIPPDPCVLEPNTAASIFVDVSNTTPGQQLGIILNLVGALHPPNPCTPAEIKEGGIMVSVVGGVAHPTDNTMLMAEPAMFISHANLVELNPQPLPPHLHRVREPKTTSLAASISDCGQNCALGFMLRHGLIPFQ